MPLWPSSGGRTPSGNLDAVNQARLWSGVMSALVSTGLWLALIVRLPDDATNAPVFWWLMLIAAVAFGAAFGSACLPQVMFGLGAPPLALAFWTAPRGDGDGLWILWLPALALFILVLGAAAWIGVKARKHLWPNV